MKKFNLKSGLLFAILGVVIFGFVLSTQPAYAFEAHILEIKATLGEKVLCNYSEIKTIGYWKLHPEIYIDYLPVFLGSENINTQEEANEVFNSVDLLETKNMLKAQLLTMKFNVLHFNIGDYPIPSDGKTLNQIVAEADSLLWGTLASEQKLEEMKDTISYLNNLNQIEYCPAEISGCTDSEVLNYNPDATINDGSCEYSTAQSIIQNALSVNLSSIDFGTVFLQESFNKSFNISLTESVITSERVNSVTYWIIQKQKCKTFDETGLNCIEYYPNLCPYLSKLPNNSETGDWGVSSPHETEPYPIAYGQLDKSVSNIDDGWQVDIKGPCFEGECPQNYDPQVYGTPLPQELKGQTFGCDLWVEVSAIGGTSPNSPPALSFPEAGPYAGDGIDPNQGTHNSTPFYFEIIYKDADGDAPQAVTLHIITEEAYSEYVMERVSQDYPDFINGELFEGTTGFLPGGVYRYYFTADDGKNNKTIKDDELSFESGLFLISTGGSNGIYKTPDRYKDSSFRMGLIDEEEITSVFPICDSENCNSTESVHKYMTEHVRKTSAQLKDGQFHCVMEAGMWVIKEEPFNDEDLHYVCKKNRDGVAMQYLESHYWLKGTANGLVGYIPSDWMMTVLPKNQGTRIMLLLDEVRANDKFSDLKIFPQELFLGLISAESAGTLNNEVTSVDSPFGGIKQVHPSKSGGWNRNCTGIDGNRNCKRTTNSYDWTDLDPVLQITDIFLSLISAHNNEVRMLKNYISTRYNNTNDGLRFNIEDGLQVLKNKLDSVNPCTGLETIEDVIFDCVDKKIVKTIWAYNGFVNPSTYLSSVANSMASTSLQRYYQGTFAENTDLRKKMVVAQRHYDLVKWFSPILLQVYDSQDNIVGEFTEGVQNTMENALYDSDTESIAILFPESETYRYVAVGNAKGTYGVSITFSRNDMFTTFTATDIPTTPNTVHEYTVNEEALARGDIDVTIKIDTDSDGVFEKTVISDESLTEDEYRLQTETITDFHPGALNINNYNGVSTVYIELPSGFDVSAIDPSTVILNGVPVLNKPTSIGDYDNNGITDLMIKFDRSTIIDTLPSEGKTVTVTITGNVLHNGEYLFFRGEDVIQVVSNK